MSKVGIEGKAGVEVESGAALLDAIEDFGLVIPLGCTAAKCGVCMVKEIAGKLAPPSTLESTTLAGFGCQSGQRLACQARIAGDVTLRTTTR